MLEGLAFVFASWLLGAWFSWCIWSFTVRQAFDCVDEVELENELLRARCERLELRTIQKSDFSRN